MKSTILHQRNKRKKREEKIILLPYQQSLAKNIIKHQTLPYLTIQNPTHFDSYTPKTQWTKFVVQLDWAWSIWMNPRPQARSWIQTNQHKIWHQKLFWIVEVNGRWNCKQWKVMIRSWRNIKWQKITNIEVKSKEAIYDVKRACASLYI